LRLSQLPCRIFLRGSVVIPKYAVSNGWFCFRNRRAATGYLFDRSPVARSGSSSQRRERYAGRR
jgi:hypothetical protein